MGIDFIGGWKFGQTFREESIIPVLFEYYINRGVKTDIATKYSELTAKELALPLSLRPEGPETTLEEITTTFHALVKIDKWDPNAMAILLSNHEIRIAYASLVYRETNRANEIRKAVEAKYVEVRDKCVEERNKAKKSLSVASIAAAEYVIEHIDEIINEINRTKKIIPPLIVFRNEW